MSCRLATSVSRYTWYSASAPMKAVTGGLAASALKASDGVTVKVPRGALSKPQVISYWPGARRAVRVCDRPGRMFSRSSSTITPSRISHSSARSPLLTMRNCTLPAGTLTALGVHVPWLISMVTWGTSVAAPAAAALSPPAFATDCDEPAACQKAAAPSTSTSTLPSTTPPRGAGCTALAGKLPFTAKLASGITGVRAIASDFVAGVAFTGQKNIASVTTRYAAHASASPSTGACM